MSQQGMTIVSLQVEEKGDGMTDNYYDFDVYNGGSTAVNNNSIGHNRDDALVHLVHETNFDNGEAVSLHLGDDTTDYQNTTGSTVYVIISIEAFTDIGTRAYKIYSAPTTDSVAGATEVFDSANLPSDQAWDAGGELLTSFLVPIQDNHFIVVENTSGAGSRRLNLPMPGAGAAILALAVEPSSP